MIVGKPEQIIGMDDPRYAPTWRMYRRAFEPLRVRAAQRHVLRVDEFHGGMTAPEIDKYLAVEGDQVVGLSWFTNHLDVVDLIEPEFFRARFPEQYAAGRIWYVMFACTDGRPGAFWGLIRAMFTAAGPGAVVVMDTCRFVDGQGMPTSTREIGRAHV